MTARVSTACATSRPWPWYSEEGAWSRWQGFGRAQLNYNSGQASTPLQENEAQQLEYFSAELREFYLRRNLLGATRASPSP